MRPLFDRVILEPILREWETESGLVIPEVGQDLPSRGRVRAVGPGKRRDDGTREPMQTKVGDEVLIPEGMGLKFEHGGKEYLIVLDDEILGIVDEGVQAKSPAEQIIDRSTQTS